MGSAMFIKLSLILALFISKIEPQEDASSSDGPELQKPTVMVALLVRNKAHTLPYFLHYLEKLDYPKHRMSLWIRSDHNIDQSRLMLSQWVNVAQAWYHSIDFQADDMKGEVPAARYSDESSEIDWSRERFTHVLQLRQQALDDARQMWADYLFMLDVDVMLTNNQTLQELIAQQRTIIAPMLNVSDSDFYSNFWCGMNEKGYYMRTKDYMPILRRYKEGVFAVPMVHTAVLIDLRHAPSQLLAYDPPPPGYNGPFDDIIIFAFSVQHAGLSMHIMNKDEYGWISQPLEAKHTLKDSIEQFIHLLTEGISYDSRLKRTPYVDWKTPVPDTMGFDQIYMINLLRRPDRRKKMVDCFEELGIKAKIVDAVDGKQLNTSYLESQGIQMMPGYADPYHKRPLTMGEIGCFLSHYRIWTEMLENNYQKILILEDDARFEPHFRSKLLSLMENIENASFEWDLIYVGRKALRYNEEEWVDKVDGLVWASYSYWTIGYLLSRQGATKLVQQKPLTKMIPVDEYIPIMFDKHPINEWKANFSPRNLLGLSVHPLFIFPTHYTGEQGYITDTEDSFVIGQDVIEVERTEDSSEGESDAGHGKCEKCKKASEAAETGPAKAETHEDHTVAKTPELAKAETHTDSESRVEL